MSPSSFRSFQSYACKFFSAFARATCSLSVCSQYLGLGFSTPYSLCILGQSYSLRLSPLHYAYEAVTLYDDAFQHLRLAFWMKRRTTSPRLLQGRIRFALCSFRSHYSLHRIRFLFLQVLRYFSSLRMLAFACKIRQSRVQSLTCGYPGLIAACHGLHCCCSQAIP